MLIQGVHRQLNQRMIWRFGAFSGRILDAIPLRFGYSNGLRQCLGHVVFHFFRTIFRPIVPKRAQNNSMFLTGSVGLISGNEQSSCRSAGKAA